MSYHRSLGVVFCGLDAVWYVHMYVGILRLPEFGRSVPRFDAVFHGLGAVFRAFRGVFLRKNVILRNMTYLSYVHTD